jgi:uncharacterized protein (DUF3820 family)
LVRGLPIFYFSTDYMVKGKQRTIVYKVNSSIDFGKYKGEIVRDIIDGDIDYILWCLGFKEGFQLSEQAIELIELKTDKSLEDNVVERKKRVAELREKIKSWERGRRVQNRASKIHNRNRKR